MFRKLTKFHFCQLSSYGSFLLYTFIYRILFTHPFAHNHCCVSPMWPGGTHLSLPWNVCDWFRKLQQRRNKEEENCPESPSALHPPDREIETHRNSPLFFFCLLLLLSAAAAAVVAIVVVVAFFFPRLPLPRSLTDYTNANWGTAAPQSFLLQSHVRFSWIMKTRNSKSTENLRQIFLRLTTMELLHSVWQHQLTTLLRFEPIGKGKEEPTSKLTTHSAEPSSGCGRRRTHVFPSFRPPFSRVQGRKLLVHHTKTAFLGQFRVTHAKNHNRNLRL